MKELYEKLLNVGILKEHNINAYLRVIKEFEKSDRVGIVHATGTGKSFIALQLIYDNSDKKFTYLVPRIGIKNQIKDHINNISNNSKEYFKNVNIMTYQKLLSMSKEEIKNLEIDYLIIDEFHHLGEEALAWLSIIKLLINTHLNVKIFGMTATPVRKRGSSKQENVADTFFKGHIASIYTLPQAIADGVLMPPIYKGAIYKLEEKLSKTQEKIIKSTLPEKEKKEYMERIENAKKQVLNADSFSEMIIKNIKPNGKYIVFCPRGKREDYQKESEQWFKNFVEEKNITRYFVDSKYPKQSEINSDAFYNDHDTSKLRLMFAMDMYIEGIHVPDIDGTIMMRSTKSEIMFFQMIGRNLNKKKQTLILDFVNNYEYIMKLKDYTRKELEIKYKKGEYKSGKELAQIFEQFDIELENINILNMLDVINKKIDSSLEEKIDEYIELLNNGYIPKARDIKVKFSNGKIINYFWVSNKEKIIKRLNENKKYKIGYEKAKQIISNLAVDKINEFIEMLNNGYIPKRNDENTCFSTGEKVNQFWANHRRQILEKLTGDEYKTGYEMAHNMIRDLSFDRIDDYIELINKGYIPKYEDNKQTFSNGENIGCFWSNNKEKIIKRLKEDEKYRIGYETAHDIIEKLSFDKISDYIELLNKGYIPKYNDTEHTFSNGEKINQFWGNHKDKIMEKLKEDTYKIGYETAHSIVKKLSFDKILDYIELLNSGYIPRKKDMEQTFSNGEKINYFWCNNKEKIIERLKMDKIFQSGYELAHKIIGIMQMERKQQIKLLSQLKEELSQKRQYIKK